MRRTTFVVFCLIVALFPFPAFAGDPCDDIEDDGRLIQIWARKRYYLSADCWMQPNPNEGVISHGMKQDALGEWDIWRFVNWSSTEFLHTIQYSVEVNDWVFAVPGSCALDHGQLFTSHLRFLYDINKERGTSVSGDMQYKIRTFDDNGAVKEDIICEPDDDDEEECPDLNLTIRGTLLPARRGTARVSGDWCK